MKILVTGSKGFVGRNLIVELKNQGFADICEYDADTDPSLLDSYCSDADFIFHLAGVNRPEHESEFMDGNFGFTSMLLEILKKHNNTCPVMISSSIQAALDNPYGKSKKAGEDLMFAYGDETGAKVLVYRFPNIFGKWCRPNYNSAVATFCHNTANGLPVRINDPDVVMHLAYIDDVVMELVRSLTGRQNNKGRFCEVPEAYHYRLGDVLDLIRSFSAVRDTLEVPDMGDDFTRKLYSTYLSYLPPDRFSYSLQTKIDHRGSFTEFIKTPDRGQVSVNIVKPGITKGNHWHHTKNEKFLAVSGSALIRLRKIGSDEIIFYNVSGDRMEPVDIPPGYVHNIENRGTTDLVVVIWSNEQFDPERPDTYYQEV